jgi:hypothetical protein
MKYCRKETPRSRVARWNIFKPKIPIWVKNLVGLRIMESVVIFYAHLEYIMSNRYIFWPLGNLMVIWYIFPRFGILCQKNLATLPQSDSVRQKLKQI